MKTKSFRQPFLVAALFPLLGLGLLLLGACDAANPVAPSGSVLTVTASPGKIGLQGSSSITVIGRKPDGNPLNPGTEIFLSTNLGVLEQALVQVDATGVARTTLRADGRSGQATVQASTGPVSSGPPPSDGSGSGGGTGGTGATASVSVQIGETAETRPSVVLNVNPNILPVEGEATVTVIARGPDGSPFTGANVVLTTTLGTLTPTRPTLAADGTATARLKAGVEAGNATVTAIVGSSDPVTAQVTIRDAVTDLAFVASPRSIPRAGGRVTLTAVAQNAKGETVSGVLVTFSSGLGVPDPISATTNSVGQATAVVEVADTDIPAGRTSFVVSATVPTGTGDTKTKSETIEITG